MAENDTEMKKLFTHIWSASFTVLLIFYWVCLPSQVEDLFTLQVTGARQYHANISTQKWRKWKVNLIKNLSVYKVILAFLIILC